MREFVRKNTKGPEFEDAESNRLARLLYSAILIIVLLGGLGIVATFPITIEQYGVASPVTLFLVITLIVLVAIGWGLRQLIFRDQVRLASLLFSVFLFMIVTANVAFFGGIRDVSAMAYVLVIIMASLFLGGRAAIVLTLATIVALLGLYFLETAGLLIPPQRPSSATIVDWSLYAFIFLVVGFLVRFAVNSLSEALERARQGETAAEKANEQLQKLNTELEYRVAARTQSIATSAEIGRYVSTFLDRDLLVKEVAKEVRDAFDYYQVHLYLLNDRKDLLELAAGAGEAGAELVASQHTVPITSGLVGRTVRTKESILAPDVTKVEEWLPNPLLPDTRSEVTVPIAQGEAILGVLDIQQNRVNGLNQDDVDLLLSISGQVAVALQNARLLNDARQNARQEALINEIGRQIQGTNTIDGALKMAVREIGRAMNAPETRIRLAHETTNPAPRSGNGRDGNGESPD